MGSLILARAAQGLGEGIKDNVKHKREKERLDLDRQHDLTLQRMRDKSAMGRQKQSQEAQMGLYDKQRKDQISDLQSKQSFESKQAETVRGFDVSDREDEQEHDVFIEAMKQFQTSTEGGKSVKSADAKWEMKVLTDTVEGPNGIPVEQDRFVVREPGSPMVLEQNGLTMLPNGQTPEEKERALKTANSGALAEAEKDLLSKAGTGNDDSSQFLEAFGYLPVSYFRKVNTTARGAQGFQSFYKKFRTPANIPEVKKRAGLLTQGQDAAAPPPESIPSNDPLAMGMTPAQIEQMKKEFLN